jgi:hypothetical protein
MRRVGGHQQDAPICAARGECERRGARRLADAALAAEEQEAPIEEVSHGQQQEKLASGRSPCAGAEVEFSAYFNQDYGEGQYRGIYLQGNEHARPLLAAWMAPFADFGMTVVSKQSVGSTDHVPFDNAGLPGFQFLQDRIPGTGGHTNLDFFDTIQAEDLMKNAVVMASYACHAAMHETRVPRKTRRQG